MPSFLIHERLTCEVVFVRRIEAGDSAEALEKSFDGEGRLVGACLGDAVAGVEETEVFEDLPHNMPYGVFYPENS